MKQLPKIQDILYEVTIPSTGAKVKVRPFRVQEEKLLLSAATTKETKFIVDTIKQVIRNCIVTEPFDVDALAMFDIEFLFITLRAKSVNNIIPLEVTEDGVTYKGEINIDEMKVIRSPEHTNKIMVTGDVGVIMKYPSLDFMELFSDGNESEQNVFSVIVACIEKIFDNDGLYVRGDDFDDKAADEFISSLPGSAMKKLMGFFETMPVVKADVVLKSSDGSEKSFELKGLQSFFR